MLRANCRNTNPLDKCKVCIAKDYSEMHSVFLEIYEIYDYREM